MGLAIYGTTGTTVSEAAAITAARVLISDSNGVPTHSTVTGTTLAFLDATSSIQTQLNNKVSSQWDNITNGINHAGNITAIRTTTPFTGITVNYGLDANVGFVNIGSNDSDNGSRTNSTGKAVRYLLPHYTNTEEPIAMIVAGSTATDNFVIFGGGTVTANAATYVAFRAAATQTTTSGTEMMRITTSEITRTANIERLTNTAPITWYHASGITQPFTFSGVFPVTTSARFGVLSSTTGGAAIQGFSTGDSASTIIQGHIGSASPTVAPIQLTGFKTDGATNRTSLASTEKVLSVFNNTTEVAIFNGAGNLTIATIKITGSSPGANKALLSDADGDGTWTSLTTAHITGLGTGVATFLNTPTLANFNTALSDADVATLAGTESLSNKTLASPVLSGTITGTYTIGGTPTFPATVVLTTATQTLTNKTLTAPIISTISNTGTLTLPTSTDTLVGRATTDTLTNKTINVANNTIVGVIDAANLPVTYFSDDDFNGAGTVGSPYTLDKDSTPTAASVKVVESGGVKTALDLKADKALTWNTQTASYTLVLTDAGKPVEINNASANDLTVPPNSSVPFPIGTQILGAQYGAGQTTIVAGSGVTIRSTGGKLKSAGQYSMWSLVKRGTDEWYLSGDITT